MNLLKFPVMKFLVLLTEQLETSVFLYRFYFLRMYSSMFYMFMVKFTHSVTVTFPQGNIFALFAYMVDKTLYLISYSLFSV